MWGDREDVGEWDKIKPSGVGIMRGNRLLMGGIGLLRIFFIDRGVYLGYSLVSQRLLEDIL